MQQKAMYSINCTVFISLQEDIRNMANIYYTVQAGDSLWKIAVGYQVGISELIAANPQIANPSRIYPNQVITVPQQDAQTIALENQVVELVNAERIQRGLRPLTLNWQLARVARYKAEDMDKNNYFSHQSPTYGSPFDMLRSFGIPFTAAAENIAYGQPTAQVVVNTWMNSAGHRANILNRNFTEIGVGYSNSRGTPYWTQMFIRP